MNIKNAQSLLCNKDEIELLVNSRNTDILCVSETWLLPNKKDTLCIIPNFKNFHSDLGRGDGVCIYIRDNLKTTKLAINTPDQCGIQTM